MTNEEFEKELKRIEQVVTELRNKLLERKAEKKPYEVEVPEDIGDYYFVSEIGEIYKVGSTISSATYKEIYERGLAFKTKEEAEQFDKERILINKLKNWAKEHNEGWKPDWGDSNKYNHTVTYDYCEKFYVKSYCFVNFLSKLPYFKSHEIAEQFIEEFGDEIKEVLC
nr:MAG TPA: hypothetical protein [Caudoviricetes sp.]